MGERWAEKQMERIARIYNESDTSNKAEQKKIFKTILWIMANK